MSAHYTILPAYEIVDRQTNKLIRVLAEVDERVITCKNLFGWTAPYNSKNANKKVDIYLFGNVQEKWDEDGWFYMTKKNLLSALNKEMKVDDEFHVVSEIITKIKNCPMPNGFAIHINGW